MWCGIENFFSSRVMGWDGMRDRFFRASRVMTGCGMRCDRDGMGRVMEKRPITRPIYNPASEPSELTWCYIIFWHFEYPLSHKFAFIRKTNMFRFGLNIFGEKCNHFRLWWIWEKLNFDDSNRNENFYFTELGSEKLGGERLQVCFRSRIGKTETGTKLSTIGPNYPAKNFWHKNLMSPKKDQWRLDGHRLRRSDRGRLLQMHLRG